MQATPGASLTIDVPVSPPGASPLRPTRKLGLLALAAGLTWAVDGATKVAAVETLAERPPVEVVPGVLDLTLTRNPGAAFSIGPGLTVVLTVVAVLVVVVVLRLAVRVRDRLWAIALGLLLGGALGNLTDRLAREPGPFQGHVVDFLRLPNWPVFNVADSCIVVAAVLIGVQAIRGIGLDGTRPAADSPRRPSTP